MPLKENPDTKRNKLLKNFWILTSFLAKNANNPSNTLVTEVMMIHKNIKNPSIFNLENLRKKRDIKNHLPDRSHLFTAETQTPNSYLQLKSLFHKTYKQRTFKLYNKDTKCIQNFFRIFFISELKKLQLRVILADENILRTFHNFAVLQGWQNCSKKFIKYIFKWYIFKRYLSLLAENILSSYTFPFHVF